MAIKELGLMWAYAFADLVIQEIRSRQAPDCILDFLELNAKRLALLPSRR
jgi:hypothetical protein